MIPEKNRDTLWRFHPAYDSRMATHVLPLGVSGIVGQSPFIREMGI